MQKDCAVMYACARLPSYNGICLTSNVLACPAMHLCVTLGKKARLHLTFSLAKLNSAISIRCLSLRLLEFNSQPLKNMLLHYIKIINFSYKSFITSYSNANT